MPTTKTTQPKKKPGWDEINSHQDGGKSRCVCGHRGDGINSQHRGIEVRAGHGACLVKGCPCERFRWAGWIADEKQAGAR